MCVSHATIGGIVVVFMSTRRCSYCSKQSVVWIKSSSTREGSRPYFPHEIYAQYFAVLPLLLLFLASVSVGCHTRFVYPTPVAFRRLHSCARFLVSVVCIVFPRTYTQGIHLYFALTHPSLYYLPLSLRLGLHLVVPQSIKTSSFAERA